MKYFGLAAYNENTIYLKPDMSLVGHDNIQIGRGSTIYKHRKIKLKEGEQYFLTLLHEIGHFKIKIKPPNYYYLLRARLCEQYPNDIEMQTDGAWDLIHPKKNESDAEYMHRVDKFRSWLIGDYLDEHNSVEDWAIEEFKKQRKEIREILKNYHQIEG